MLSLQQNTIIFISAHKDATKNQMAQKMFELLQGILCYIISCILKGQNGTDIEHGITGCKVLHVNQINACLMIYTLSLQR